MIDQPEPLKNKKQCHIVVPLKSACAKCQQRAGAWNVYAPDDVVRAVQWLKESWHCVDVRRVVLAQAREWQVLINEHESTEFKSEKKINSFKLARDVLLKLINAKTEDMK